MNDRYLYRAKLKNWRELPKEKWWVEGYYAYMQPYHYIMPKDNFDSWIEIDEKTLCACTGLKDKNGKLIWENDIVNVSTNKGNTLCEVRYADSVAQFQLWQLKTLPKTSTVLNLGNYEEKVCGNIFDNPELLEVGE